MAVYVSIFSTLWAISLNPYCSYDTCDLGTFPNQTLPDHSGPAAALQVQENGRSQYNNELSWLPGQRLS